jgi:hypothetical protein
MNENPGLNAIVYNFMNSIELTVALDLLFVAAVPSVSGKICEFTIIQSLDAMMEAEFVRALLGKTKCLL